MNKNKPISGLFYAAVIGIYAFVSIIIGLITDFAGGFMLGFGFFSFAAVVALAVLYFFGRKGTAMQDVYLNAPIYYIGLVYYVVAGVICAVQMLLNVFTFKWMLVVQLVVFGIAAIYFIFALVNRNNAVNVTEKVALKNDFIRTAASRLESASRLCEDRELKLKLEHLSEEFRYSKPAASADLAGIEDAIMHNIGNLENKLRADDLEAVAASISSINKALIQRNEIARTAK